MPLTRPLRSILLLCGTLLLGVLACGPAAEQIPTRVPTVALPTETPPATATIVATATALLSPTLEQPTATAVLPEPAATQQPTETTPATPAVELLAPGPQSTLLLGSEITVAGLAQLDRNRQTVIVELLASDGRSLAQATATVTEANSWQADLEIPPFVAGPAQLQVSVRDLDDAIVAFDLNPILLVPDTTLSDRYLALYRPVAGSDITAVAGYYLFFDGYAQRPNGLVTIAILTEDCQTIAARQSFTMSGSGYWQGFIVIPRNVSGPACAVAYTSTRGDESWREVQLPIDILPGDHPDAHGILISAPASGSQVRAGEAFTLYGVAYNAPDDALSLSVLLENGRIVTQQLIEVQPFGYWEIDLLIPVDVVGPAELTISADENDFDTVPLLLEILPAATPRP